MRDGEIMDDNEICEMCGKDSLYQEYKSAYLKCNFCGKSLCGECASCVPIYEFGKLINGELYELTDEKKRETLYACRDCRYSVCFMYMKKLDEGFLLRDILLKMKTEAMNEMNKLIEKRFIGDKS
jgi:hypothetical protein